MKLNKLARNRKRQACLSLHEHISRKRSRSKWEIYYFSTFPLRCLRNFNQSWAELNSKRCTWYSGFLRVITSCLFSLISHFLSMYFFLLSFSSLFSSSRPLLLPFPLSSKSFHPLPFLSHSSSPSPLFSAYTRSPCSILRPASGTSSSESARLLCKSFPRKLLYFCSKCYARHSPSFVLVFVQNCANLIFSFQCRRCILFPSRSPSTRNSFSTAQTVWSPTDHVVRTNFCKRIFRQTRARLRTSLWPRAL